MTSPYVIIDQWWSDCTRICFCLTKEIVYICASGYQTLHEDQATPLVVFDHFCAGNMRFACAYRLDPGQPSAAGLRSNYLWLSLSFPIKNKHILNYLSTRQSLSSMFRNYPAFKWLTYLCAITFRSSKLSEL